MVSAGRWAAALEGIPGARTGNAAGELAISWRTEPGGRIRPATASPALLAWAQWNATAAARATGLPGPAELLEVARGWRIPRPAELLEVAPDPGPLEGLEVAPDPGPVTRLEVDRPPPLVITPRDPWPPAAA